MISSAYVTYETQKIQSIETRLLDNHLPSVLAGEKLLDGIHLSLAGLRGYMILGEDPAKADKFKAERAKGWEKIDSMVAILNDLSQSWKNSESLEQLSNLKLTIEEFRQAQQEVEDISHSPGNIVSLQVLSTEAAPQAKIITDSIRLMIDEEAHLEASDEHKNLLTLLADSYSSFSIAFANIRAYLLSGNAEFKEVFEAKWAINEARFKQISEKTYLFDNVQKTAWEAYSASRESFAPLPDKMFTLRSQDDWNKANYWLGTKAAPKAGEISAILVTLAEHENELVALDTELLHTEELRLEVISIGITVVSIIIGIAIAVGLSNSITSQLKAMTNCAKRMAVGDLTSSPLTQGRIKDFNSLSTALNTTSSELSALIKKILASSNGLSTHSTTLEQLMSNSQTITDQQQEETDLIVTAMNEMGSTVKEVALSTTEAASSAEDADTATSEGHKIIVETVDSINELAKAIENAAETINQLGEETNAVDTILVSISSIADQTNLLALNAAIEAARAGEQGRGFAVVADEVRTLAARTQESTIEIRSMLDRLKVSANGAVDVMSAGHKQAQGSVKTANKAKESLKSIASTVNNIRDMNTQIATAAEEQSVVTDEMSRNISAVNKGAQKVSQQSVKSLTSAHEMAALASQLAEGVAKFNIVEDHG